MTGSRSFGVFRRRNKAGEEYGNYIAYGYLGPGAGTRQRSTGTKNEQSARLLAAEWFANALGKVGVTGSATSPTLRYAWTVYQTTDRYTRLAENTRLTYDRYAGHFIDWAGPDTRVDSVTDVTLRKYRDSLELAPRSVNTVLTGPLAVLFDYCLRRGWIRHNPLALVRRLEVEQTPISRRGMFSQAEMDALEQADPDNAPLWSFYRWTGARRLEALSLNPADIGEHWIHLRGSKNARADRQVPVLPPLRPYLDRLGTVGRLWDVPPSTVQCRLYKACELVGRKRAGFKHFRRAYITWLQDRMGTDYESIGRLWVGHGQVSMSDRHYRGRNLDYEHGIARNLV